MKFQLGQIMNVLNSKGYNYDPSLSIIGIRSNNTQANSFDDWLYLLYKDSNGNIQTKEFMITTDPGAYWLSNPMNVDGTAILIPGQYKDVYRLGMHQGRYEALIQAEQMRVWRDKNKDGVVDKSGPVYRGVFGINIHRSGSGESNVVEKWSAGSQVFKKAADFSNFMDVCKASGKNSFTYTLLEEMDF